VTPPDTPTPLSGVAHSLVWSVQDRIGERNFSHPFQCVSNEFFSVDSPLSASQISWADKVCHLHFRTWTLTNIVHRASGEPMQALNRSHTDWIRSPRRTPSWPRICPPSSPSPPLPSPPPSPVSRRRLPPRRHPPTSLIYPLSELTAPDPFRTRNSRGFVRRVSAASSPPDLSSLNSRT